MSSELAERYFLKESLWFGVINILGKFVSSGAQELLRKRCKALLHRVFNHSDTDHPSCSTTVTPTTCLGKT